MDDRLREIYETPISEMHNLPIKDRALVRLRNFSRAGGWLNYKLHELARQNLTEKQETAVINIAMSLQNLTGGVDWNTADEMYAGWEEDQLMDKGETLTRIGNDG